MFRECTTRARQVIRMVVSISLGKHFNCHPEEARGPHMSTPACISQVAAV
jgi:hypothetical protein